MGSGNPLTAQLSAVGIMPPWQPTPQNFNMMNGWTPQLMAAMTMASRMSMPVSGEEEEEILVCVLSAARQRGTSFRQAIESELHGVRWLATFARKIH